MARFEGKVALITGVARGQGRSHALRLAEEGAQIIGVDICAPIDTVAYAMATPDDLAETVKAVEERDARIVARQADVRDREALRAVVEEGIAELGHVDFVLANAGILPIFGDVSASPGAFDEVVAVNLTGVYNTIEAVLPAMLERGVGGSIVLTSSVAGLHGRINFPDNAGLLGYTAAKHALVGLVRAYAGLLGEHHIRVNSVHPTGANTPMIINPQFEALLAERPEAMAKLTNPMGVELIEASDITSAVVWLCSDEARYITGVNLPVDAGFLVV
jgi:SDR family mycofactocin-dependent oxidoreductase